MLVLTFPRLLFDRLRERLREGDATAIELPLSVRDAGEDQELLVASAASAAADGPTLRIVEYPVFLQGITHLHWHARDRRLTDPLRVELAVFGTLRGCSAAVLVGSHVHPLDRLWLPGPGLESWRPAYEAPAMRAASRATGRFSRYAGALGGDPVHARLCTPSFAIIGVSRLGSQMAVALAKAGVRRLALVDGDVVEPHNVDAMEVSPRTIERTTAAAIDIDATANASTATNAAASANANATANGKAEPELKVAAVAEFVRQVAPGIEVTIHPQSVQSPRALRGVAGYQCLVSTPDRGSARLLAAVTATAYNRVHLDIGTGVLAEVETERDERDDRGDRAATPGGFAAGIDLRLMLPDDGCLLCAGGVGDLEAETWEQADWRRQRAGSLRSLNSMAAGYGMFLLERLAAGELRRSTWVRLQLAGDGSMEVTSLPFERRSGCPLCALGGAGDRAWLRHTGMR